MTNLITVAAGLMDGSDIVVDTHGKPLVEVGGNPANPDEYLRGMTELICEAYGLSMDEGREIIVRQILDRATTNPIHVDLGSMSDEELDAEQFRRRTSFQRALSQVVERDPEKARAIWNSLEEDCSAIIWRSP